MGRMRAKMQKNCIVFKRKQSTVFGRVHIVNTKIIPQIVNRTKVFRTPKKFLYKTLKTFVILSLKENLPKECQKDL